jgi:hypothetical protein
MLMTGPVGEQLFSVWPKELRGILRKALKAEERGDYLDAEKAYAK